MKRLFIVSVIMLIICPFGQLLAKEKVVLFDLSHGDRKSFVEIYRELLADKTDVVLKASEEEITPELLVGVDLLIMISPMTPISAVEAEAIVAFVQQGGSLFFTFDEEKRFKLNEIGANAIVNPFGISYALENTPVRHNCGAKSVKGDICSDIRELPYSGGRVITGGKPLSYAFDEGNWLHMVYETTERGGKIIATGDAMASLLYADPDGIRFSGTGPDDSKFWGKDNAVFIKEVLAWLLR